MNVRSKHKIIKAFDRLQSWDISDFDELHRKKLLLPTHPTLIRILGASLLDKNQTRDRYFLTFYLDLHKVVKDKPIFYIPKTTHELIYGKDPANPEPQLDLLFQQGIEEGFLGESGTMIRYDNEFCVFDISRQEPGSMIIALGNRDVVYDIAHLRLEQLTDEDGHGLSILDALGGPGYWREIGTSEEELKTKISAWYSRIYAMLAFMKLQPVEIHPCGGKSAPASVKSPNMQMANYTKAEIRIIDVNWNVRYRKNGPFWVGAETGGFWRMQKYGKGRSKEKLILISPYMKHGYNRPAKKEKQ